MKKLAIVALAICSAVFICHAQRDPDYAAIYKQYPYENLKVGAPCPDFKLNDVRYYHNKEVSLADLKGKNVILDFFNSGCGACFRSMPKINHLKQKFGDAIEVFYVGRYDTKVEKVYEKYRNAFKLKIPVVYDSILCWRFVSFGFPEYIWIGKDGIIKAITGSEEVNEGNLSDFIAGRPLEFVDRTKIDAATQVSRTSDTNPLVYKHNPETELPRYKIDDDTACLYKSEFGSWDFEVYGIVPDRAYNIFVTEGSNAGRAIEVVGSPQRLYFTAYFGIPTITFLDSVNYGKLYQLPALQGINERTFNSDRQYYWYRLIDRRSEHVRKEDLLKAMQADLRKYFGYQAKVEERLMPYYKIIVTDKKKAALLKSKSEGGSFYESGNGGIKYKNGSWKTFVVEMRKYINPTTEPTIIDETGIDYNIDIEFEAAMQSPEDVNRALQKFGLGLGKGEKKMKVLVVSKPNQNKTVDAPVQ